MFSLGPLLLVAISVAGLIFDEEAAHGAVRGQLAGRLGPEAAHGIEEMLAGGPRKALLRRFWVSARPERPTFTVLDRTALKGVGLLVSVELDQDSDDFAHLVGKKIVINGRLETCFSVERFNHLPPWRAGERIGPLIRKARPRRLV
jgi:hypothetical protein